VIRRKGDRSLRKDRGYRCALRDASKLVKRDFQVWAEYSAILHGRKDANQPHHRTHDSLIPKKQRSVRVRTRKRRDHSA